MRPAEGTFFPAFKEWREEGPSTEGIIYLAYYHLPVLPMCLPITDLSLNSVFNPTLHLTLEEECQFVMTTISGHQQG